MSEAVTVQTTDRPTLLEAVTPSLDLISSRAPAAREARQVSDEVVSALGKAGIWRAFLPAQWGGLEAHPQEVFEALITIAERDMSTAWITGSVKTRECESGT